MNHYEKRWQCPALDFIGCKLIASNNQVTEEYVIQTAEKIGIKLEVEDGHMYVPAERLKELEKKLKGMTVKEVAESLGVSVYTIKNCIRRILPEKLQNGKTTYLNEEECTAISIELKNNGAVLSHQTCEVSSQVKGTTTELEENLMIQNAINILIKRNEDLQKKVERLEPAANFAYQLCSSKDTIDIGECAKVLDRNIGRNKLFEFLRNKNVLNAGNVPYQKYIDAGYFRVIESKYTTPDGETHITLKTLVFQKGVAYINRLLRESAA